MGSCEPAGLSAQDERIKEFLGKRRMEKSSPHWAHWNGHRAMGLLVGRWDTQAHGVVMAIQVGHRLILVDGVQELHGKGELNMPF